MAHEIMEHDNTVSAIEIPWHGLGTVLDHFPTIAEAQEASGLTWTVSKQPILYKTPENEILTYPDQFITVREDINYPLGIVGKNYVPYQNDKMFAFMQTFLDEANSKLETAGSLRNGRTTWAMAQAGTAEIVNDDPINKYFLFRNSFDGTSSIQVAFTNVRVVCNNTLTAALKSCTNMFNIRHTQSMHEQLEQIQQAITASEAYQDKMKDALAFMANMSLDAKNTQTLIAKIVKTQNTDLEDDDNVFDALTSRSANIYQSILGLVETGKGADIKGVKGTIYGLYNAITEYSDHYRTIKSSANRSETELRFDSNMFGTSAEFKAKAFNQLMKYAVAA